MGLNSLRSLTKSLAQYLRGQRPAADDVSWEPTSQWLDVEFNWNEVGGGAFEKTRRLDRVHSLRCSNHGGEVPL